MRQRRVASFAVCAVFAAAACGGGGTYGGTTGPTGGGAGMGSANVVTIADYSFTPTTISVKAGSAVTWQNQGGVAHTVTADGGGFNSGQLAGAAGGGIYGGGTNGASFVFNFPTAGSFTYHCANHPGMTGTVTVTP